MDKVIRDRGKGDVHWKWTRGKVHHVIRCRVEAINHLTGTGADPSNQIATINLLDRLAVARPKLDSTVFRHLWPRLVGDESPAVKASSGLARTTLPVVFEVNNTSDCDCRVKIYFIPHSTPSISAAAQIFDAIRSFNYSNSASIKLVEAFLQNDCVGKSIVPIMLGIDYIHPLESRLKVYARSHPHILQLRKIYDELRRPACSTWLRRKSTQGSVVSGSTAT
ncbi:tryptophan dimethylallyltransferase-domain-containing protein [Panaeolus papilionaceus]|nr:tryptophan dimethylallyltransferase-domain-containing protein [Panaeolus papilionaceus]